MDNAVLRWILGLRNPELTRFNEAWTWLGNLGPMTVTAVLLAVVLLLVKQFRAALVSIFGSIIGYWLMVSLKLIFDRPRPGFPMRLVETSTASMPSGHAMLSAIVFGFAAWGLGRQWPRRQKQLIISAVLLSGAIGFSRIYLAAHWLSDVLVGWSVGVLFVWLVIRVFGNWVRLG